MRKVILKDICEDIQYGYTASATDKEIGPKFLRITDIVSDIIDWQSVPYCKIEESNFCKYALQDGDIVIARTGATTGYAKYIKKPPLSLFASYLVRLKIKKGIDKRYIGYIIQSQTYKDFIKINWSGAAQPNANAQVLTSFPIPLPDINNQKIISSILSAYDDLIKNNLRRIQILEEMAQLIYREWFVNFRFPGYEKIKFVNSEMGKIPEGWEVGCIKDLYGLQPGYAFKSKDLFDVGQYPIIKIRNIQHPMIDILNCEYIQDGKIIEMVNKFVLSEGDFLIAMTGAQVGKVGIMPKTNNRYFLNQRVGRFVPMRKYLINNFFLYLFCISDYFKQQINNLASGAAQPNISGTDIDNIKIIIPSNNLLEEFTNLIDPAWKEIISLNKKNQVLRVSRDILLPKLISGELDVSDLDDTTGDINEEK